MRRKKKALSAIDLFAGAGGVTQGLKTAGFSVIGAVEYDNLSCESYSMNHPEVKIFNSDIRTIRLKKFMRDLALAPGALDLLVGCPPCQGFSAMRRLNGGRLNRDPRKNLLLEMSRFIRTLKPKAVMLENVPHAVKDKRFWELLRLLRRNGYQYRYWIANAADFGVPQRRKRLILMAATSRPELPKPSKAIKTVRHAIGQLPKPALSKDPLHKHIENRSPRIMRLIAKIPRNGGSRSSLKKQLNCHTGFNGFKDVYGRMPWDSVAPTITGGCTNPSRGRFLHPTQNRSITLREAALLQSFPKNYKFSLARGKYAAAVMIGNALPPRLAARHASALRRVLLTNRN